MKIVIDISDQKYKWIVENPQTYTGELHDAIRKGTPLPEHHTNEVLERIKAELIKYLSDYDFGTGYQDDVAMIIDKHIEGSDSE